jgi:MFS family permease
MGFGVLLVDPGIAMHMTETSRIKFGPTLRAKWDIWSLFGSHTWDPHFTCGRWASDKVGRLNMMSVGLAVTGASYLLLGPAPFLPLDPGGVWPVFTALVVLGLGSAMAFTPTLPAIYEAAQELVRSCIRASACLSVRPSVRLSGFAGAACSRAFVRLSARPCVCQSVSLSICLSMCRVRPSIFLSMPSASLSGCLSG